MLHNTLAKAKLVKSKIKKHYRIFIAFNVYERTKKGDWKFPVQAKCNYVSGDFELEDLARVLNSAKAQLRTNNIEIV